MGRQPRPDHQEVAENFCVRTGSKATVWGNFELGRQYVIGVDAVVATTGYAGQGTGGGCCQTDVLKAVGKAAAQLRSRLGESLSTIQQIRRSVEAHDIIAGGAEGL